MMSDIKRVLKMYQAKTAENQVPKGGGVFKKKGCSKLPEIHFGFGIFEIQ